MDLEALHANYQPIAFDAPRPQPKKKAGNFLESLLPSIGGIGGGAAGAAIGTALLPGVGTLAGALLGGAFGGGGGKVAENALEHQALGNGVAGQALEQGIFSAGPLRLLKGAKAATTAVRGGSGIADALRTAGEAAQAPGLLAKTLGNASNKMYAQAFTVPRRLAGNVKPEQTAQELMQYGVGGSLDKIGQKSQQVLKSLGGHFDRAVNGINGQVKVGDITTIANDALKNVAVPNTKKAALLGRITDIGANGKLPGYANPSEVIDHIRDLENRGYNFINAGEGGLVKNPETADLGRAYLQVAKEMEDNLYKAIGSRGSLKALQTKEVQQELNSLAKGLGDKFVGAKTPEEVRSLMAPFVRAQKAVRLTRDEAQAAGSSGLANLGSKLGMTGAGAATGAGLGSIVPGVGTITGAVGGALAAPLLRGAEEAARAPLSTGAARVLNRVSRAGVGEGKDYTAGAIAKRSLPVNLVQALAGSQANAQQSLLPNNIDATQQPSMNNTPNMSPLSQNNTDLSSQDTSPFAPENIEANVQQLLASGASLNDVSKFLSIADTINSIQQSANQTPQLNSTTATQLASSSNALNTLQQLQQLYEQAGGGGGKIGGTISNLLGDVGLNNNAATYNSLAASSVSQLARALNGGGQVSDKDAEVVIAALPKTTDTPAVAKAKFDALLQRLQAAQQNTLAFGSGSTPDLSSVLGGAQ